MKTFKMLAVICLCTLMVAGTVYAKDLKGKVGLGFNSQLSENGMDSVSAKYWLNNDLGFQGIFGFTFSDDVDELDLGGKVMYKLIDEDNMYVAGIGGLGMSRVDPDQGDSDTGWWLSGGVGNLAGRFRKGYSGSVNPRRCEETRGHRPQYPVQGYAHDRGRARATAAGRRGRVRRHAK